ncbi:MAG: hypothetical protein ACOY0R_18365 [Chloroflexota bacterium]
MSIDCEVSLKSLLFVTESVENLLGLHGSQAVLRSAGRRAAASLIDMLPLTLAEDEALLRVGGILVELGFVASLERFSPDTLRVGGNRVLEELAQLGLASSGSARYYVIGLFEGFFKQLCGSAGKIVSVEADSNYEYWKLG